jgi:hypothetical protein
MWPPGDHLSYALLADLADGQTLLSDVQREHLAACQRCTGELAWLQRMMNLSRGDMLEEPPAHAVERAKALFRQIRRPLTLRQRLVEALLRFDSATSTPAFGLRASAALERQILLDAEGATVDLRIARDGERWVVSGQLLSAAEPPAGAAAELLGPGGLARSNLSPQSEFSLPPVRSGRYRLTIESDTSLIVIPELDLGA